MDRKLIPVACTLPADGAVAQAAEWTELAGHAISVVRVEGGVAMTFEPALAAGVEDLAAREARCCTFLSIATERTDRGLRLEVTSGDPDALPVIEAMAGMEAR